MNHCLIAQDTALVKKTLFIPIGCYYKEKSFLNKKPDDVKPFRVVSNYRYKKNGDSIPDGYSVQSMDSSGVYNSVIRWSDSAKWRKLSIFCFYDGRDVYLHNGSEVYYKMDGLGKFPYCFSRRGFSMPLIFFTPFTIAAGLATVAINSIAAAGGAANMNKMDLYFYNRKRKYLKATPESIAWLIKDEKDLYKEYEQEGKITTTLMLKYLQKMNERYPDF